MKRSMLIFLLLGALLNAEDYDTFIGAEVGSTNIKFDKADSQRGSDYGLRFGFIKDTGRVFLSINKASIDNVDLNAVALNFDAITARPYRFNSVFSVRGLIGLHGGMVQIKPDGIDSDEGAMGGAKAGVFFDFPADISIEIGYKVSWADLDLGIEPVKNYQTLYASYNYTF